MATAIAIAGVAAAAASAAAAGYQASQSGAGGGGRAPKFKQTPEPGYEKGLREYTARLLAQGATSVPPSLLDWASSGGKATFDLGNTAMTPGEAVALGTVGKRGQPVPWTTPGQKQLTPEQMMFLVQEKRVGANPQIRKDVRMLKRLSRLEDKPQKDHPRRQAREENLIARLQYRNPELGAVAASGDLPYTPKKKGYVKVRGR